MKKIANNIYVSTEMPGVNVGFITLPAGAIAIDVPTLPQDARVWREQILETAAGPILYVVLTDAHPDRLLSAGVLEAPIVAVRAAYDRALAYTDGFWRSVVDGWSRRYPEAADGLSEASIVLPEIMLTDRLTLHKGGTDVMVEKTVGGAPGSAWVYLPEQDVLFAGDTVVIETHPFMEATPDTKGWLETLQVLRRKRYSDTIIVPGHGPLCRQEDTRPLSEYIALVRRRMRSLQRTGRVRADRASVVGELQTYFPIPEGEQDTVQRRIKAGLDRLDEEFREE
jgi:glyoxylase-like metal-dependent hydrolase (beta-lactamase superfamily II)